MGSLYQVHGCWPFHPQPRHETVVWSQLGHLPGSQIWKSPELIVILGAFEPVILTAFELCELTYSGPFTVRTPVPLMAPVSKATPMMLTPVPPVSEIPILR